MTLDFRPQRKGAPSLPLRIGVCLVVLMGAFACERTTLPTVPPTAPPGYPKPYRVMGEWHHPIPDAKDFRQEGIASWYGAKFHGKKTSSGEIYDMHAVSAAHKTLPFHTHVRVRNQNNNREIIVRINDRGPFVRGRIIDLSYAAAQAIDIIGPGTAPVEIVALGTISAPPTDRAAGRSSPPGYVPADYYLGNFTVQVGAFKDRNNAERLARELDKRYKNVQISEFNHGDEVFYRVRVGKRSSLHQAVEDEAYLVEQGFESAFVVAE